MARSAARTKPSRVSQCGGLTLRARLFDKEARVWVATKDALRLATEADTLEVLAYKLQELLPEFADLNHIELPRPIIFTPSSRRPLIAFA